MRCGLVSIMRRNVLLRVCFDASILSAGCGTAEVRNKKMNRKLSEHYVDFDTICVLFFLFRYRLIYGFISRRALVNFLVLNVMFCSPTAQ